MRNGKSKGSVCDMSPLYNFSPVIPDHVKDLEYPTLKEMVEEFIRHYGNTTEEELDDFDLEDAVQNIVSLWDEKFKDDPYWIINPDGELGWYGCDEFESCYEQLMEHFDYEFPDIDELIEEFDFDEKLIFCK